MSSRALLCSLQLIGCSIAASCITTNSGCLIREQDGWESLNRKTDNFKPALSGPQWAARAAAMQRAGNLAEAAVSYERAIQSAGRPAPLWVDLGNVRQDQGDQDAALACSACERS